VRLPSTILYFPSFLLVIAAASAAPQIKEQTKPEEKRPAYSVALISPEVRSDHRVTFRFRAPRA